MKIPYRPTSLTIKQVNVNTLEEIEKKNLEYFFPNYSNQNFTVNPETNHPISSIHFRQLYLQVKHRNLKAYLMLLTTQP